MREGEPGWFYVSNGQLQYKDSDGWTDQHIEGPGTTSPTVNIASSGQVDVKVSPKGRKPRRRTPALVIAVCVGLLRPDVVHGWASWATVQAGQVSSGNWTKGLSFRLR